MELWQRLGKNFPNKEQLIEIAEDIFAYSPCPLVEQIGCFVEPFFRGLISGSKLAYFPHYSMQLSRDEIIAKIGQKGFINPKRVADHILALPPWRKNNGCMRSIAYSTQGQNERFILGAYIPN